MVLSSISLINQHIESIPQIATIIQSTARQQGSGSSHFKNIGSLNLHANSIKLLDPGILGLMTQLRKLDLSSNMITSMLGLEAASALQEVNLSNNKILHIESLGYLRHLKILNLSFNRISSLNGFEAVNGPQYSLTWVDLKGNVLDRISDLSYLSGTPSLRHLILTSTSEASTVPRLNPICKDGYDRKQLFRMLPQLLTLDGCDIHGIFFLDTKPSVTMAIFEEKDQHDVDALEIDSPKVDSHSPMESSRLKELETQVAQLLAKEKHDCSKEKDHKETLQVPPNTTAEVVPNSQSEKAIELLVSALQQSLQQPKSSEPKSQMSKSAEKPERDDTRISKMETMLETILKTISLSQPSKEAVSSSQPEAPPSHPQTARFGNGSAITARKADALERFMTLPTKIPHDISTSQKPMSLVWVQEKGHDIEVLTREKSTERRSGSSLPTGIRRTSKRPSENHKTSSNTTSNAFDANLKLISALEAEERRLRESDQRLRDKNRVLTTENTNLKAKVEKLEGFERQVSVLQEEKREDKSQIVQLSTKISEMEQRLQELSRVGEQKEVDETYLKRQIETLRDELSASQSSQKTLESTLQSRDKEIHQLEQSLSQADETAKRLQGELSTLQSEKSQLSLRLLKDRDTFRSKLSDLKKEKESFMTSIDYFKKEVEGLREVLQKKDSEFRRQLDDTMDRSRHEAHMSLAQTSQQLQEQHRLEMDHVTYQLNQSRHAYSALEEEFRKTLDLHQGRSKDLHDSHQQALVRIQRQETMLNEARAKETELTSMVRELSKVVKEQKIKMQEMAERHKATVELLEEDITSLEERANQMNSLRQELHTAKNALTAQKKELESEHTRYLSLQAEHGAMKTELEKHKGVSKQLSAAEKDLLAARQAVAEVESAVQVKNKMLDDQNDTIRRLKSNLENKVREHQAVMEELAKAKEGIDDQIEVERTLQEELRQEIEQQMAAADHYKKIAKEYKHEKDTLKAELESVKKILEARNLSIEQIESEVSRLRDHFKTKEEKFALEKEAALQQQRLSLEGKLAKLDFFEKERTGLLSQIRDFQSIKERLEHENERLHHELRVLLVEFEKQKAKAADKILKLKAALTEEE